MALLLRSDDPTGPDAVGARSRQRRPRGLAAPQHPGCGGGAVAILAGGRCIVCVSPLNGDSKVAADIGALDLAVIVGDDADWQRDALTEAASRSDTITIGVVDDID